MSAFVTISSATPLLALMIGLAVGIDYALFILSRHRNQLANGVLPEESAATAVATAGSAVVFAGVTVIIALLGLLVVNIPFLTAMGISAAFAVLLAILVSMTMLPAMMGVAGARLAPKPGSRSHRRALGAEASGTSFGTRWVKLVLKAPLVAVLLVVGILGTLAIPAFSLNLALPDGGSEPEGSPAREAYDMITEGFGPGQNGPLIVLVDITQTVDIIDDLDAIGDELRELDGVEYVSGGLPNETLDTAIIRVIPETGPDNPATTALVQEIRDLAPAIEAEYDMPIAVTGTTAVQIDISTRLNNALVPFGVVVVGLSIILLMMVFRSVFVPLKAAAGFLLSVLASFGVVVAIFQWGWFAELLHVVPGPILSFMPILLMAVLFGLAMDYEVFLVSGMRENWVHHRDARRAIVQGFAGAARVVTAAALIMFFVFAAFVPEGAGVIKVIALGLAFGILADAFLVRMTLVPAAMALAGRAAWWMPQWLGRILPNVDIEGENLREHRDAVEWARAREGDAVTAEGLVAGTRGSNVGPVTGRVARGSLGVITGSSADRRLFAATVAGRLEPVAGRLQVLGNPLPSDASRVVRLVALAELGASDHADAPMSWRQLLEERVRLTGAARSPKSARVQAQRWIDRVNASLPEAPGINGDEGIDELAQLHGFLATASLALAEGTPMVVLNQQEDFADPAGQLAFVSALDRLAFAGTTIMLATSTFPSTGLADTELAHPAAVLELRAAAAHRSDAPTSDRKGALA